MLMACLQENGKPLDQSGWCFDSNSRVYLILEEVAALGCSVRI